MKREQLFLSQEFQSQSQIGNNTFLLSANNEDASQIECSCDDAALPMQLRKGRTSYAARLLIIVPAFSLGSDTGIVVKYRYTRSGRDRLVRWVSLLAATPGGALRSLPKRQRTTESVNNDVVVGSNIYAITDDVVRSGDLFLLAIELGEQSGSAVIEGCSINDESGGVLVEFGQIPLSDRRDRSDIPNQPATPADQYLIIKKSPEADIKAYRVPQTTLVEQVRESDETASMRELSQLITLQEARSMEWARESARSLAEVDRLRQALDEAYLEISKLREKATA